MSFNVINASRNIVSKYRRYLKTIFDINDPEYKKIFLEQLDSASPFSQGPYLDVVDSFRKGHSVTELISSGILHHDFKHLKDVYNKTLYVHQEESIQKVQNGRNLVVSTGTGSGKTECFLLPILDSLMKEKERCGGKLSPGVRALIVYPMNALANDQVDRLRATLSDYKDITFGCYTGQTEHRTDKALLQYGNLNRDKETGEELKPQINELISREQMKEKPPHILITNYAMLEYLMLRPADNVFFDGEFSRYWKFIVLDEAHTYTGSTGIEVSLLLRRLIAKLKNPPIQYILTSATLGDENSNKDVVNFAGQLCNSSFDETDVIRATRVSLRELEESSTISVDIAFYRYVAGLLSDGYDDQTIFNKIYEKFGISSNSNSINEFLFDYLSKDDTFWRVKSYLSSPQSVIDICNYMGWTLDELSDFVEVASNAYKDRTKLFDSRYHLFIKATDGVFITLPPHKDLFLSRRTKEFYNDEEYKVFEVVSCTQCHSLYLYGRIVDGHLEQRSTTSEQYVKEAFLIGDTVSDTDDDDTLEDEKLQTEQYELCPHCGFIRKKNIIHKQKCEHGEADYVILTRVATSEYTGRVTKCLCCESVNRLGVLRAFFTGQEASTSVIGTALFEELPSHDVKIVSHSINEDFDGFEIDEKEIVETQRAKQFIAFSDNRQAAAYYATYFSETYDGLLYGRLIRSLCKQHNGMMQQVPLFIKELAGIFKKNQIFPFGDSNPDYVTEAWKAILKEMVDNKLRHSLMGLGLVKFGIADDVQFGKNDRYRLSLDEVKNICTVFILGMLPDSAIYYDKSMTDNDIEYFAHGGVETTYLLYGSNSKVTKAFIPRNENKNNKRLDFITRVLKKKGIEISRENAIKLLEAIWKNFFIKGELLKNVTTKFGAEGYRVNTDKLTVGSGGSWYICSKCHRLTYINIDGVCPNYMCDGELHPIDVEELFCNNHYYRMFNDLDIRPLRVVEHTAQLSRDEAYKYQNMFKAKQLDVLSCSTTFEMGVDVGELETVFMRNMPPTPANYTQRAGRAGRSMKSAAFAVTFCNKSNHDFNYFNDPVSMIKGVITPPSFKVDNEKICIRHVYSAALAFFWRLYPCYFKDAKAMMEDGGYFKLKEYLYSKPNDLKCYLLQCLPESIIIDFQIETFGWVDWLFDLPNDKFPNLKTVYELYTREMQELEDCKNDAIVKEARVDYLINRMRNYRNEDIISFLSKNSILPKYGFPVDTVNLSLSRDSTSSLDLSRDLSMAISEYAPGCQVVANGKLITSRYIRKMPNKDWKMYDYIKCDNCQTLNMVLHTDSIDERLAKCRHCGQDFSSSLIKTFLIPDFGFVAERAEKRPTLIKPERTFKTEAAFVNYNKEILENEYDINGTKVKVASINNGRLGMLTTDDFFVCRDCGYSLDGSETSNKFVNHKKLEHRTSYGAKCGRKELDKFTLGYTFETDVIRIYTEKALPSPEAAYSVLQALILSACSMLNIDNNEIAGCLQYNHDGYYNFILYDTTPGGAGHVKRLDSQISIVNLFEGAFNIANCSCCDLDSSCYNCLRTYRNQRHHDDIKRKYVIDYINFI